MVKPLPHLMRQSSLSASAPESTLKFGNAANSLALGLPNTVMASAFSFLEHQPLAELLVKDILGFNLPKMAVALGFRGKQDFWDVARLELGNTAWTLATSFILPVLITHPIATRLSGLSKEHLAKDLTKPKVIQELAALGIKDVTAHKLAHLGGALGFILPFALGFSAVPFLRNALTLKQTGTINYQKLIGLEKSDGSKQKDADYDQQMAHQLGMAKKIMLAASGLAIASTIGLPLLAKKLGQQETAPAIRKTVDFLYDKCRLKGWKNTQFGSKWGSFLFWQLPAYVGWVAAARSPHEKRERVIQSANAMVWFSAITPLLVRPAMAGRFIKEFEKHGFKPTEFLAPEKAALYLDNNLQKQGKNLFETVGLKLKQFQAKGKLIPDYSDLLPLLPGTKDIEPTKAAAEAFFKANPEARKGLLKALNLQMLADLGISISMLATTPALLNVFLTRHEYNKQQQAKQHETGTVSPIAAAASNPISTPSSPEQSKLQQMPTYPQAVSPTIVSGLSPRSASIRQAASTPAAPPTTVNNYTQPTYLTLQQLQQIQQANRLYSNQWAATATA